jgi:CBS domain-containing protein
MTSDLITVTTTQHTGECMALMTNRRIRHLPVVEEGRLIGIVSIGDVVRAVIDEQQFLIDQLEQYITS